MKESDITPEVIAKAKEIARHWRMEIYKGCWLSIQQVLCVVTSVNENEIGYLEHTHDECIQYLILKRTKKNKEKFIQTGTTKWFPIPSISDCLEKLLELGYEFVNLQRRPFKNSWGVDLWDKESHKLEENTISRWRREDKALHLALLSALLGVLTEKEKK